MVKLYLDEDGSAEVARLLAEATVVAASALTYSEVRSALTRRRRENRITARELKAARLKLDDDWASVLVVPCNSATARSAGDLAEQHALRGADAVQLAAFERLLASTEGEDVEFSCADERLTRAAKKLG